MLGAGLWLFSLPAVAAAFPLPPRCGGTWTTACASVSVELINGGRTMRIVARNISTDNASSSILTGFLLRVSGGSGATLTMVRGDGQIINGWALSEGPFTRVGRQWNIELRTTRNNGNGNAPSAGVCTGIVTDTNDPNLPCGRNGTFYQEVEFYINFDQAPALVLEEWAFHAQHIAASNPCPVNDPFCESDWTTEVVPEPLTIILLGTGLAGMGGVGALRRRRREEELTEG